MPTGPMMLITKSSVERFQDAPITDSRFIGKTVLRVVEVAAVLSLDVETVRAHVERGTLKQAGA